MSGEKPHVVSVVDWSPIYWLVDTSDQRPRFVKKATHTDELAAYMAVTEILKKEQDK